MPLVAPAPRDSTVLLHVVLVRPRIPQNVGAVARTAAATGAALHIVGPLPFELSEKRVRRAGLDYWPFVSVYTYASWEEFTQIHQGAPLIFVETGGSRRYDGVPFAPGAMLVFGDEERGLREEIPEGGTVVNIPMATTNVRSLNLSNCVSIVLFEAFRQIQPLWWR